MTRPAASIRTPDDWQVVFERMATETAALQGQPASPPP
jgi:hypothetical protein